MQLTGAAIAGQRSFAGGRDLPSVTLVGARCARLNDDGASWAHHARLKLRSFRFDSLMGGDNSWRQRRSWARKQGLGTDWSPDPYEQLAAYYRSTGDDASARHICIERHSDGLAHARTVRRWPSLAQRTLRRTSGRLVGYGYRRWPAVILLGITILSAGLVFGQAHRAGDMVPADAQATAKCDEEYPCFNRWAYGADLVLPIVALGQDDAWLPIHDGHPWWVGLRWVFIVVGWALATVFVASFTRLVGRE